MGWARLQRAGTQARAAKLSIPCCADPHPAELRDALLHRSCVQATLLRETRAWSSRSEAGAEQKCGAVGGDLLGRPPCLLKSWALIRHLAGSGLGKLFLGLQNLVSFLFILITGGRLDA